METAPQKQQRYRVSIVGALAGMIVTFLLGVYVGVHPNWIPIKTSSSDDFSKPVKLPPPAATMPQKESSAK